MTNMAIEAKGLTRYFGTKAVVDQASFSIPVGTVTGLLGLNGAGKSTTIKMLMGFLAPTRGSCSILGVESMNLGPKDRARIGYTIEGHFLYSGMRVRDLEQLQSESFPRWDSMNFQATIDRFGIANESIVRTLSRGQRAGVAIALTLSSQPELLILDDPALGLDPVSRRALNETILTFMEDPNRTVLLSSHMLDDIERVTDRVLIMLEGRIIVDSTIADFVSRVSTWRCDRIDDKLPQPYVPGLIFSKTVGKELHMFVADVDEEATAAMQRIGGVSLHQTESSFDENVLAYLSRSRSSKSFLSSTSSIAKTP